MPFFDPATLAAARAAASAHGTLDISSNNGDSSPGRNATSGGGEGASHNTSATSSADGRDPMTNKYACGRCNRSYLHQATLVRHRTRPATCSTC